MIYVTDDRLQVLPRSTTKPLAWVTDPSLFLYLFMGAFAALLLVTLNPPATVFQLVVQSFVAGIAGGSVPVRSTVRLERQKVLALYDGLTALRGHTADDKLAWRRLEELEPHDVATELRYALDDDREDIVATLAERDKATAFVFLAVELERAVARLAAKAGLPFALSSLADILAIVGAETNVPQDMLDEVKAIAAQRNTLVHGHPREAISEAELDRLLGVGLRIFRYIKVETVLLEPRRIG